jgi:F-type H+-transporting ATPase subunit delta
MYIGQIANRYAKALADFAVKNGEEESLYKEVQQLIETTRQQPSVRDLLASPVAPIAKKLALIRQLLGGTVSATLNRFVEMTLQRHREGYLRFIFPAYIALYKRQHGIHEATLTVASPLEEQAVEQLLTKLTAALPAGETIRLQRRTDESLIGGFVFRMDDLRIDTSLARQLTLLRKQLGNTRNRIV